MRRDEEGNWIISGSLTCREAVMGDHRSSCLAVYHRAPFQTHCCSRFTDTLRNRIDRY